MLHLINRKRYLLLLILFLIFLFAGLMVVKIKRPHLFHLTIIKNELQKRDNEKVLGVYYKEKPVLFDTLNSFTHLVLTLNNNDSFHFNDALLRKVPNNHNILLTIEFWGDKYQYNSTNDPVEEIMNGLYDKKLRQIEQSLIAIDKNIFVRINPEMEVPVKKYPWQNNALYISAYRYLVLKLKSENPKLKFVWGPSGFMGAEELYPGNDVVDAISITLKSEVESLFKRYPSYPDLANEIHKKLHRMRFFNKPVILLGTEKVNDSQMVYNLVNAEIDSIARYRSIAYNDSLWMNSDTVKQSRKFIFGMHDPNQLLTSDPAVSLEHIFVDFGQVQSGELNRLLNEVFSRNHDAILTVEPWRDLSGIPDSNVLQNIVIGKYDSIIQRVFADVSNTKHNVYLRFAHEMEIPITRYAWQSKDPIDYIRAFRYFMTFVKRFPSNVKRIWGPAGDRASLDFYPGDDVVDYVSIAIYGLPDKNITDHNKQESFSDIFNEKKWRLRQINKPLFITEFGVKGPEDFQTKWLEAAAKTLNENPQVIGINYFNMSDTPGAWGDIKEPDWSITPNSLHRFMEVLERDDK